MSIVATACPRCGTTMPFDLRGLHCLACVLAMEIEEKQPEDDTDA